MKASNELLTQLYNAPSMTASAVYLHNVGAVPLCPPVGVVGWGSLIR